MTREVSELEYEAYREMAAERIEAILRECAERHGLEAAAAEHRTGTVPLGEPAVIVAVAAAHRTEAFAGAREAIDRIKAEAPIWKREVEGRSERVEDRPPGTSLDENGEAADGRRRRQAGERAARPRPRPPADAPGDGARSRRRQGTEGRGAGTVARLAGIQAAKQTPSLIPLAHPLPLSFVDVEASVEEEAGTVELVAAARTVAQTGVEMEAMTAAAVAALTVYDMVKGMERGVRIEEVVLLEKGGGRSDWRLEEQG